MARPAFSKIRVSPEIDLTDFLKVPEDIPRPLGVETISEQIFGRSAPLELEIGCGKGLFIRTAAAKVPQHNFLGVEIGKKYATLSAAGLTSENLSNAKIVCGDAAIFLRECIPNESLDAVHVYFPDPWWKRAHKKRRVLREEVVKMIEERLKPNGIFHFWTDVLEYYQTTLKLVAAKTKFLGPFEIEESQPQHEMDYHTHFERRTRLHGEPVYRCYFRKN
ncbi:MAG: tRNA (guanosine(46)-N7)-methyltransferase TrmB [Thermoguttaceae bacterium]